MINTALALETKWPSKISQRRMNEQDNSIAMSAPIAWQAERGLFSTHPRCLWFNVSRLQLCGTTTEVLLREISDLQIEFCQNWILISVRGARLLSLMPHPQPQRYFTPRSEFIFCIADEMLLPCLGNIHTIWAVAVRSKVHEHRQGMRPIALHVELTSNGWTTGVTASEYFMMSCFVFDPFTQFNPGLSRRCNMN